jgi:hypothetical protein
MRVAIGLAAILVTIGVIVWIMSAITLPATQQALNVKKKVEPQVQQVAGVDSSGRDARDSIKLDAESSGGKMTSVLVTAIDANGAMAKYFGLKRGDSIVEIAPQGEAMTPVREMSTPTEAKDMLLSAFQRSQHIVVVRDGQKLTLPLPAEKPAAGAGGKAAGSSGSGNPLQDQLNAIQNVPTH